MRVHGLKRSPRTLANLRSKGGGPRYHRIGAIEVLYSSRDLDEWARAIIGTSTINTAEERALGRELPSIVGGAARV